MKRKQLFEFEDFEWLPKIIRNGVTNLIVVYHKYAKTSDAISELVMSLHKQHAFDQITDLGSGSGGPMLDVVDKINKSNSIASINLVLTDLHPNPKYVQRINGKSNHVTYHDKSIDATNIKQVPPGLKTMIASFHHMDPDTAKKILQSAQGSKQPILIYELMKNTIPVILWWLLLPISLLILVVMSLVMTPFVRPLTIGQLFFTFIIPIIPLVYAWDGQASLMRTYTFNDVKTLLGPQRSIDYHWEINDVKSSSGRNAGYYIMGYPVAK